MPELSFVQQLQLVQIKGEIKRLALRLTGINENEFDVVLVFGPMYHLPPEERDMVFEESKRICKIDGIIMFAYQSKLGAYLQAGILFYNS
jgi:hypothetical protein